MLTTEERSQQMKKKSVFEQLAEISYLPLYAKAVTASLELDVYSRLTEKATAKELSSKQGWNEKNTNTFWSSSPKLAS